MIVMQLERTNTPLVACSRSLPAPGPGQVLLRVLACGVCRTDLHVVDGELAPAPLPIVPGHEVVAVVEATGPGVELAIGARVGLPWLGWACGECPACRAGRENLCDAARFTGYTLPGGYATHVVADARWCLDLAGLGDDAVAIAPLLCAGLIGWRALRAAGDAPTLALYGFGAAAHLIAQVAVAQGRTVFAHTRPGDARGQAFARALGAAWAGGSDESPPAPVAAAIVFAPVGALVPAALAHVAPGGRVVCAGIHMSDIPAFPYSLLWRERSVASVANLTRADGREFLAVAARVRPRVQATVYALRDANRALADLRGGAFDGAAVLVP